MTVDFPTHLDYINRFLSGVYQNQDIHRLGDLLRRAGLGDAAISALAGRCLPDYLSRLCRRWRAFIAEALPERHADIVIRRFALDGRPPPRLADLGREHGICRERVRQLEASALRRLRSHRHRQTLQEIALEVAYEVIGLPPEAPEPP